MRMGDILVASKDGPEHKDLLCQLFRYGYGKHLLSIHSSRAAKMLSSLYSALAGKPKTPKTLEWREPMVAAFQDTKAALARAVMLVHPCSHTPTSLTVEASEQTVGAVLQQLLHGIWQPLAFFSKQLCHIDVCVDIHICWLVKLPLVSSQDGWNTCLYSWSLGACTPNKYLYVSCLKLKYLM